MGKEMIKDGKNSSLNKPNKFSKRQTSKHNQFCCQKLNIKASDKIQIQRKIILIPKEICQQ
jgi:hypothetical protein